MNWAFLSWTKPAYAVWPKERTINQIFLKTGREKSVIQRHPWIFASAIERLSGSPQPGETVEVFSSQKEWLARAAFSPQSQIRARIWTWDKDEPVDRAFFEKRLTQALRLRHNFLPLEENGAQRLIHAESDGLPGFIVDRYNNTLVMQVLSCGAEVWRQAVAEILVQQTGISDIYERSDVDVRTLEGLPERTGPLLGNPSPAAQIITENGLRFQVDLQKGHKTGFYLDQRRNRQRIRELARGKKVLNCFCYTGAFSIYALAGGAESVLSIDSSADVLDLAAKNLTLNNLPVDKATWMEGDVFKVLRTQRDRAESYDLIILDPPKFAPTVTQAERAARGYKDINLLAIKLLRPGGTLVTFSCSGGISAELFQKIVADAALDAGVFLRLVEYLRPAADHPVALNFPEGAYLKGLICAAG